MSMQRATVAVMVATTALTGFLSAPSLAHAPTVSPPSVRRDGARIVDVIDGDTVRVRFSGREAVVRLLGIDTPEVYGRIECGGPAASRSAKRLLAPGTRVTLVSDPSQANKDRYRRLLRYVERRGTDINRAQVRRGWAAVYVYDNVPFRRTHDYRVSQQRARRHDRGVWGRCDGNFHR